MESLTWWRAALAHHPNSENLQDLVAHAWLILFEPSDDRRWTTTVRSLAESFAAPGWGHWDSWVRAFARIRLGEAEVGIDALAQIPDAYGRWPAIALAQHRLGHEDAARSALSQAEETAEHHFWITDLSRPLVEQRDGWVQLRALRRQAQRLIANKSLQDLPAERMFRGRVLYALGEERRAEAELAAAIGVRPNDPEPWLARSRIYAKLGRMDRASADRLKAQDLKGSDPQQTSTWIETGRLLAEMGEQRQADKAFTRALALGNGALYPFLESGWWVVGPYPPDFELSCPPEIDPDPSRPVAAVDGRSDLRWSSISSQRGVGGIDMGSVPAASSAASLYLLSYVYADRPREAVLNLMARGDVRLWVNGRLAFDGYAAWHLRDMSLTRIGASLTAGRNTILIKYRPAEDTKWIQCRFDDTPVERAVDLARMHLWSEAADAFAGVDREVPLSPWHSWCWIACLVAAGREPEARQVFSNLVGRYTEVPAELVFTAMRSLEHGPVPNEWIAAVEAWVRFQKGGNWPRHRMAVAYYLAGRYAEAEAEILAVGPEQDFFMRPLLAAILHRLGKTEEARKSLQEAERQHALLVKETLARVPYQPAAYWEAELWYRLTAPEARRLILGKDPGPTADDLAIHEKSQKLRAELGNTDGSARLVLEEPERPWHWVDRGRRFGELDRWDEAARAFAKAVELAPKDPQIWKARGQALAGLGRWDDAAADLARALDLTIEPTGEFPYYPWRGGRGEVDALIARSDELHGRVARQRHRDRTLSARRAEFLAEAGRWPEAEAVLRGHIERFPDDWWAPGLLAKRLLDRGELSEYRMVCRQALDRFGGRTESFLSINLARTALIGPSGFEDHPLVRKLIADADGQPVPEFWLQSTAALAELRRNDAAAASSGSTPASSDVARPPQLAGDGRRDPRAGLPEGRPHGSGPGRARSGPGRSLEVHRRRPDLGAEAWDWHNWTQLEILAREAAGLIPSVPATAAAVSLAREQAVRGEREARAGRVATRMALVRIGMDLGANDEVLGTVKDVLVERTRIAAEEPANTGYLADMAETQTMLGRLIALPPQVVPLVPTSPQKPGIWRFTTAKPPEGWTQPNFDDSGWKQGPGGFGALNDAAHAVHTTWNTPEIWIRRTVEIPASLKPIRLRFEAYHDEDLEVSLDGVPAARWEGYSGSYVAIEVPVEGLRPIKSGGDRLVMAAHCRNTPGGPQGLDVGVAAITIGGIKLEEGVEGLRRGVALAEKLPPSDPRRAPHPPGRGGRPPRNRGDAPKGGAYRRGRATPA